MIVYVLEEREGFQEHPNGRLVYYEIYRKKDKAKERLYKKYLHGSNAENWEYDRANIQLEMFDSDGKRVKWWRLIEQETL